jgi:hypothetical protein
MLGRRIGLLAVAVFLTACTSDKPTPTAFEVRAPLFVMGGNSASNLGTHLTGDEEVCLPAQCPVVTPAVSPAQGQAIFSVNADGSAVDFRLIASNIDNAFMAHIHCGAAGTNGPIRMWLYPVIGATGPTGGAPLILGPQNGVLASGTFNPTGITCPDGTPLLTAIRNGLTYVNVHTNDGQAPANTGPGDFPGGEIRGQIDDENN